MHSIRHERASRQVDQRHDGMPSPRGRVLVWFELSAWPGLFQGHCATKAVNTVLDAGRAAVDALGLCLGVRFVEDPVLVAELAARSTPAELTVMVTTNSTTGAHRASYRGSPSGPLPTPVLGEHAEQQVVGPLSFDPGVAYAQPLAAETEPLQQPCRAVVAGVALG